MQTFTITLSKPIEVYGCDDPVDELAFEECVSDKHNFKLRKFMTRAQTNMPDLMEKFGKLVDLDDVAGRAGEAVKPLHEQDGMSDEERAGTAAMFAMVLGQEDDLEDMVQAFGRAVADEAICTANGNRVKEEAWKRIKFEDKVRITTEYCVFFNIGLASIPTS